MRSQMEQFVSKMEAELNAAQMQKASDSDLIDALRKELAREKEKTTSLEFTIKVLFKLSRPSIRKGTKRKLNTVSKSNFELNLSSGKSRQKRRCLSPESLTDYVTLLLVLLVINILK